MPSSPAKPTASTEYKRQPAPSKLRDHTRYALASTEPDPSTAGWMTSDQAMSYLQSAARQRRGLRLYAQCPMCNTVFTRDLGKFRKAKKQCEELSHTCSNRCSAQLRALGASVARSCDTCGQPFREWASVAEKKRQQGVEHHFCSNECYGDYRSRTFVGESHHLFSAVELSCHQCGDRFFRKRSGATDTRTKRPFCDRECYAEWLRGRPTQRNLKTRGGRYYPYEFKRLRAAVMATKPKCVACGKSAVDLHHRDEDPENNELGNLAPVCRSCHTRHHQCAPIASLSPSSGSPAI